MTSARVAGLQKIAVIPIPPGLLLNLRLQATFAPDTESSNAIKSVNLPRHRTVSLRSAISRATERSAQCDGKTAGNTCCPRRPARRTAGTAWLYEKISR
jgi:hypothetical protein